MKIKLLAILLCSLSMVGFALAADEALPPPDIEVDELQPEVTIIKEDNKTTYEYSANGQVYMVKIVPIKGPAYYLLDLDGDGQMDEQRADDPGSVVVPQWVLLRW